MKLSTKSRYRTRVVLDIAVHLAEEPVLLRDIAQIQQISLPCLEQLVAILIASNILRNKRGIGGGVSLARPPEDIAEQLGLLPQKNLKRRGKLPIIPIYNPLTNP